MRHGMRSAHLDGLSRFLQSPDQYRIYLGSRGYAGLKTVESADHKGVVLAYLSPAGQEVLARLWPGGAGIKAVSQMLSAKGRFRAWFFGQTERHRATGIPAPVKGRLW